MALKTPDNQKLLKLLALTTSPNDNEALAAMRKANQALKAQNLSWKELLEPEPNNSHDPLFAAVSQMLAYCIKNLNPCQALDTARRLEHKVTIKGSLTFLDIQEAHELYSRVRKVVSG